MSKRIFYRTPFKGFSSGSALKSASDTGAASTSFWRSKKFWTLLAALVAAFAAYFSVGCATHRQFSASHICVDSVYYEGSFQIKR